MKKKKRLIDELMEAAEDINQWREGKNTLKTTKKEMGSMNRKKLRLTCLKLSKEILERVDNHGRGMDVKHVIADAEKLLNWINDNQEAITVTETPYESLRDKTEAELLAIIRGKALYIVKG